MENFTSLINSYLPEPHASLLNGILLGVKLDHVTTHFYESLKTVGLIHIVVLSGMNITMLSAIVLNTIVPIVGRRYAMIVTIFVIIGFIFFVGIEPPIVRATIMGILSLVGLLFGRKTIALYTLFLSSIILIIIFPEWLTSISFQLSFGATLGIILFGNVEKTDKAISDYRLLITEKNIQKSGIKNSISVIPVKTGIQKDRYWIPTFVGMTYDYIKEELRISLAAQIFTVPIIFFYFRQISFVAPIANILVAWLIAPIMILGIITILVGSIWWQGGFVLSWLCYGLISIVVMVVETLAKIPYASLNFDL